MQKYKKAVTFSYDDGVEQDRKLIEIFNKYGMKATFNLNTGIQSPESCFDIEVRKTGKACKCLLEGKTCRSFEQSKSRCNGSVEFTS